jgi:hypothetical protein
MSSDLGVRGMGAMSPAFELGNIKQNNEYVITVKTRNTVTISGRTQQD